MIINSINNFRLPAAEEKVPSSDGSAEKLSSSGKNNIALESAGETSVSSLASQLAASAAYSAEKNKALSTSDLSDKANKLVGQITGPDFEQWKIRNDREIPKATDAASIDRAKAATAFVNGRFKDNVGSEPNPFAGLSAEQLATIAYDESGTFTVNERRAAWHESYRLEEGWRIQTIAKMNQEYATTGKLTNFFKDALEHYEQLPLMEQVQYPKNYVNDLKHKIKRDFNYRDSTGIGVSSQNWIAAAKSFLRPMLEFSSITEQS